MNTDSAASNSHMDLLDITPLARRYGFNLKVTIARELADCMREENEDVIGCVLRAAADALMMRSARLSAMRSFVFAIDALRAPAEMASRCRLALRLDNRHFPEPTITLGLAT